MDEHTLNDLLECSVCLDRLDTSSKVLPCQHTFCRKCLEVIVSSHQELRCPECRVLIDIKIDDLPPNVLLMRILEGMKNAAATKTTQPQITMQLGETSRLNNSNKQNNSKEEQAPKSNEQNQLRLLQQQQQQQYQIQLQQQYMLQNKSPQQQQQQNTQPSSQIETSTLQQQQQQRRLLPHAYAIHAFESTEPTDLHFKKGDLLLLKRKIDENWYVGQANGVEGTFPINYVRVIVPLPMPQCIALYDFKMGPNEEEGCLSFKKGTVIHVLRRVDHNWAEGRINNAIGIFPIAFVRLNTLAEQILNNNCQITGTTTSTESTNSNLLTTETISSSSSSASSSATTIPSTTTTNSIPAENLLISNSSSSINRNDNSTPSQLPENTPQQICAAAARGSIDSKDVQAADLMRVEVVQLRYREGREKRHSLNALLNDTSTNDVAPAAKNVLHTNRHSAEILSISHEQPMQNINAMPQTTVAREQQQQQQQLPQDHQKQAQTRCNILKSPGIIQQQMIPPTLPWGYLALYPYKPRKNDELELKKGCVYIVTERCLDGWFKGKNWQDTLGVFPGNYVTPLRPRDQKQLMHQWKHVPLVSMASMCNIITTATTTSTMATAHRNDNVLPILQIPPPDAPPRKHASSVSPTPSSSTLSTSPSASTTTCASVWTKPLGHTVEAFFNRHNNNATNSNKTVDKNKENSEVNATSTCAAVNLMKRLASMKSRSKSPVANAINNPEPVAAANRQQTQAQLHAVHPVHVR